MTDEEIQDLMKKIDGLDPISHERFREKLRELEFLWFYESTLRGKSGEPKTFSTGKKEFDELLFSLIPDMTESIDYMTMHRLFGKYNRKGVAVYS